MYYSKNIPPSGNFSKISFYPQTAWCIFLLGLWEKMTAFPSLNIFDAFELDVSVVNFVYYGKTRLISCDVVSYLG